MAQVRVIPTSRQSSSPRIGRKAGAEITKHQPDARDLRNYNCEALLISAVITTGDKFIPDERGITTEHFETHQATWEWLQDYAGKHQSVPSLAALMGAFPRFKYVQTAEVGYATEEVLRAWARRQMSSVIRQAAEHLRDRDEDAAVDLVMSETQRVQSARAPVGLASSSISDHAATYEYVTQVFDRTTKTGAAGIPTGFKTLDQRTGGLGPGQLWVPAARLGNGKSWIMLRAAAQAVMTGHTVHFWSLEMPRQQIEIRLHVLLAHLIDGNSQGITVTGLEHGTGSLLSYRKALARIKREVPGDFYYRSLGRERVAPRNINAALERDPADVVFVDYLQLLEPDHHFREKDWRAIADISRSLKQIAIAHDIPFMAASQVNREGDGRKPPRGKHLSQSDAIGQDADDILTMKIQSQSVIEFWMEKVRSGPGQFTFFGRFKPDTGDINEIDKDEAEDLIDADHDREDEDFE